MGAFSAKPFPAEQSINEPGNGRLCRITAASSENLVEVALCSTFGIDPGDADPELAGIGAAEVLVLADDIVPRTINFFSFTFITLFQDAIAHPICDRLRRTAGRSFWYVWNAGSGFVSGRRRVVSIFLHAFSCSIPDFLSHQRSCQAQLNRAETIWGLVPVRKDLKSTRPPPNWEAIFRPEMAPLRKELIRSAGINSFSLWIGHEVH